MKRRNSLLIAVLFLMACQTNPTMHLVQGEAQGTTYTVKYMAEKEVQG